MQQDGLTELGVTTRAERRRIERKTRKAALAMGYAPEEIREVDFYSLEQVGQRSCADGGHRDQAIQYAINGTAPYRCEKCGSLPEFKQRHPASVDEIDHLNKQGHIHVILPVNPLL